jgi:hypothetical protein
MKRDRVIPYVALDGRTPAAAMSAMFGASETALWTRAHVSLGWFVAA